MDHITHYYTKRLLDDKVAQQSLGFITQSLTSIELEIQGLQDAAESYIQASVPRLDRQKHCSLLSLPAEILIMIFEELGPLTVIPQDQQARHGWTRSFTEIHPCYAICSASRRLRECYLAFLRIDELPEIKLKLEPWDYDVQGNSISPKMLLHKRLQQIGHLGKQSITKIWVAGPEIERLVDSRIVTKWLHDDTMGVMAGKERTYLKGHFEREITDKQKALSTLFKNLQAAFGIETIKELYIYNGELPATAWKDALVSFVSTQQNLERFAFTTEAASVPWDGNGGRNHNLFFNYHPRIFAKSWFEDREDEPSNHPATLAIHKHNFERLHDALNSCIEAKLRMKRFRLSDRTILN